MSHQCGCIVPPDLLERISLQNTVEDDGTNLITVHTRFIVIYHSEDINISDSRIQQQHERSKNDFLAQNEDALAKVPTSGVYNFASTIGNAGIMLVLDEIVRHQTEVTEFADLDAVVNYANIVGGEVAPKDGVINSYVCQLREGLLGQARFYSNVLCLLHATVFGNLPGYDQGGTYTHELGHVFEEFHTFHLTCGSALSALRPDIPDQKNPNYSAVLVDGDGALCNHYQDCGGLTTNEPSGSLSCSSDCARNYEQFMNFMDYARDADAVMFSKSQCEAMRQYLLSGDVFNIEVGGEVPDTTAPDGETENDVDNNGQNGEDDEEDDITHQDDSDGLSTAAIAGIVIGSVFVVSVVGYLVWNRTRRASP